MESSKKPPDFFDLCGVLLPLLLLSPLVEDSCPLCRFSHSPVKRSARPLFLSLDRLDSAWEADSAWCSEFNLAKETSAAAVGPLRSVGWASKSRASLPDMARSYRSAGSSWCCSRKAVLGSSSGALGCVLIVPRRTLGGHAGDTQQARCMYYGARLRRRICGCGGTGV